MRTRTKPVDALTDDERQQMWGLFERYYKATKASFLRDLAGKTDVILAIDGGRIVGFSTLARWRSTDPHPYVGVFSGDTVMDAAYWGAGAIERAFGRYTLRLRLRHRRVYWFLTSKGYKTYLLLARNFKDHWPRRDAGPPEWVSRLLDQWATKRYGDAWDADAGVVRHSASAGPLREGIAPIGPSELADPDIAYFARRVPGHAAGDELACLGRVDLFLLPRFLWKRIRRRLVPRPGPRTQRDATDA